MDLEAIKTLKDSLGWKELGKEIDKQLDTCYYELKRVKPEALVSLQERVKALEMIKRLPEDVLDREE